MRPGTILVVGYGNELRGDDAAGRRAADRVDSWRLPGVEVRALHQLTPELAEPLAAATRAIFLDAHLACDNPAVRVHRIEPATTGTHFVHTSDPQALLHLARTAFGRSPDTWWITIPAADFNFGAPISAVAARGIADALTAIRPLLNPALPAADAVAGTREERPVTQTATAPGGLVSDGTRAHGRNAGCPTR
jgi:hydrogenase maturation protease